MSHYAYGAVGIKERRPIAPAAAHNRASERIVRRRLLKLGDALSNTIVFRCFQIHHTINMINEEVPLPKAHGVD